MKRRQLTQKDVDTAFAQGLLLGWRLCRPTKRRKAGRPKLSGELAYERALKKWMPVFNFIDTYIFNDSRVRALTPKGLSTIELVELSRTPEYARAERRAANLALDAAANEFHKDRSTVERAWRKWNPAAATDWSRAEKDFDLVEKWCTLAERRAAVKADDESWTSESSRRLVRVARIRARKSTANN